MIKNVLIAFVIFIFLLGAKALEASMDKEKAIELAAKGCEITTENETTLAGRLPVTGNVWTCPDGAEHFLSVNAK